jgi:hypothetical protein
MPERDALWVLNPAGQRASGEWIDDTLRERAAERGMLGKITLAADFPRQRVEVIRAADPFGTVNEVFYPARMDRWAADSAANARPGR